MNTERISKIRELIEAQGRISLDELTERFKKYSSMTLRRDLIYLEEQG
ncbi:MAG: DeoR family transcriptional regulator, partial [Clostridiales bacterium]|nr:DeoR family transcriptional regulator [Clostridiales bacterium]